MCGGGGNAIVSLCVCCLWAYATCSVHVVACSCYKDSLRCFTADTSCICGENAEPLRARRMWRRYRYVIVQVHPLD